MTKQEAIQILTAFNRWRRCNDGVEEQLDPFRIGKAIDFAIKFMAESKEVNND